MRSRPLGFSIIVAIVALTCPKWPIDAQAAGATLHPFTHKGRVGYVNDEMQVVIPPSFHRARHFSSDGYAAVEIESNRWGIIDKSGRIILSRKARSLSAVSEGFFFEFPESKKFGRIADIRGFTLVEQLGDAYSFSEGL